jgi:tetratricopeptide (TPR) repeat protein
MKFKSAFGISTTLFVAAVSGHLLQSAEAAPPQKQASKKTTAPERDVNTGAAITYFNQGVGATNAKNYLQAVQFYKASRDADPDYLNAYVNEVASYLSLSRPDLAIDTASKGIARCNKNNDDDKMVWEVLHQNRGNAYMLVQQPQKAVADYTESMIHDISQRGCIARAKRGVAYVELGEYQKAENDFNFIAQLRQNDTATQTARVLVDAGRKILNSKMQADSAKALMQCKDFLTNHDYDKAIVSANTAVSISPKNLDALLMRSTCYAAKHQVDKSDADLSAAEKLSPNDGKVSNIAGIAHLMEGDSEKAVADFQTALARNYSNAQLYLGMSAAQSQLSRFDDAVKSVNEAIRLSPNDSEGYNLRSLVYLITNTPENSIADANAYLEKTSWKGIHSADSFLRIYMLSKQLDQKDAADKILETAATQLKSDQQIQRVIELFQGKIDADALLKAATTPVQKTDAQISIAIKAVVDGDKKKAEELLREVKATGSKNSEFYLTGIVQLARMLGTYTPPKVEPA